jgi:hypothetical protein
MQSATTDLVSFPVLSQIKPQVPNLLGEPPPLEGGSDYPLGRRDATHGPHPSSLWTLRPQSDGGERAADLPLSASPDLVTVPRGLAWPPVPRGRGLVVGALGVPRSLGVLPAERTSIWAFPGTTHPSRAAVRRGTERLRSRLVVPFRQFL